MCTHSWSEEQIQEIKTEYRSLAIAHAKMQKKMENMNLTLLGALSPDGIFEVDDKRSEAMYSNAMCLLSQCEELLLQLDAFCASPKGQYALKNIHIPFCDASFQVEYAPVMTRQSLEECRKILETARISVREEEEESAPSQSEEIERDEGAEDVIQEEEEASREGEPYEEVTYRFPKEERYLSFFLYNDEQRDTVKSLHRTIECFCEGDYQGMKEELRECELANDNFLYFLLSFVALTQEKEVLFYFYGTSYDFSEIHPRKFASALKYAKKAFPMLGEREKQSCVRFFDRCLTAFYKNADTDRIHIEKNDVLIRVYSQLLQWMKETDTQIYKRQAYYYANLLYRSKQYENARVAFEEVYPYRIDKFECAKKIFFSALHIQSEEEFRYTMRFDPQMPQYKTLLTHCDKTKERMLWIGRLLEKYAEEAEWRERERPVKAICNMAKPTRKERIWMGCLLLLAFFYSLFLLSDGAFFQSLVPFFFVGEGSTVLSAFVTMAVVLVLAYLLYLVILFLWAVPRGRKKHRDAFLEAVLGFVLLFVLLHLWHPLSLWLAREVPAAPFHAFVIALLLSTGAYVLFFFICKLLCAKIEFPEWYCYLLPFTCLLVGIYAGAFFHRIQSISALDILTFLFFLLLAAIVCVREIPELFREMRLERHERRMLPLPMVIGLYLFPMIFLEEVGPFLAPTGICLLTLYLFLPQILESRVFLTLVGKIAAAFEKRSLRRLREDPWKPSDLTLPETAQTLPRTEKPVVQLAPHEKRTILPLHDEEENFPIEEVLDIKLFIGEGSHCILPREYANENGSRCDLRSVSISDDVLDIGEEAFIKCGYLAHLDMGQGVKAIQKMAFAYCGDLSDLCFSPVLEEIGEGAFAYCRGLTEVRIPDGVKSIGEKAFFYAHNLKRVMIPKSVTHIGADAFAGCKKLTVFAQASERPEGWAENFAPTECEIQYHYHM